MTTPEQIIDLVLWVEDHEDQLPEVIIQSTKRMLEAWQDRKIRKDVEDQVKTVRMALVLVGCPLGCELMRYK